MIGRLVTYDKDGEIVPSTGSSDEFWLEDCIRIIGDNERPLILQSYWKPAEKYSRRFELRSRQDLLAIEDGAGAGISERIPGDNLEHTLNHSVDNIPLEIRKREDKPRSSPRYTSKNQQQTSSGSPRHTTKDRQQAKGDKTKGNGRQTRGSGQQTSKGSVEQEKVKVKMEKMPTMPFLLNIRGARKTVLTCPITDTVTIGRNASLLTKTDLHLDYKDILPQHCVLRLAPKERTVHLEVVEGAVVKVNNELLQQPSITLKSGDVLSFGRYVVFLFRDPNVELETEEEVELLTKSLKDTKDIRHRENIIPSCKACEKLRTVPEEEELNESAIVKEWRQRRNEMYENDTSRFKISYVKEREDDLLERCMGLMDRYPNAFALTPAYMFSMIIEYCSVKYDQYHTRQLLLKVANVIQNVVWVSTFTFWLY